MLETLLDRIQVGEGAQYGVCSDHKVDLVWYHSAMSRSTLMAPLRRLRSKLTLSHTAVTVTVFLTLITPVLILAFFALNPPSQVVFRFYRDFTATKAAAARSFLEAAPPDSTTLLEIWLRAAITGGEPTVTIDPAGRLLELWARDPFSGAESTVIVNPAGELLATNTQDWGAETRPGQPFVDPLAPDESRRLIGQALEGKAAILGLPDGRILAVQPILGEGDAILGALYLRTFSGVLRPNSVLTSTFAVLVVSLVVLIVIVGLTGALFGRLTSRGLVRRLERLNNAAGAWGQGDFSVTVHDTSPDEIGQLARRMQRMADQIQDLLQARQELATLEERNRVARDLHDSVKQHLFATTMTLGAAKAVHKQDPEAAWHKVDEALDLSWEAQQELTGLILQLRPVALKEQGLADALREFASRWSRQTGIEVSVASQCQRIIPPEMEQALFRLAQEALANVAKHSGAGRVEIMLTCTASVVKARNRLTFLVSPLFPGKATEPILLPTVILQVTDNGRGFDPAAAVGQGLGLRSMRERIEALDGELTVESAAGIGTRIVARCPLE